MKDGRPTPDDWRRLDAYDRNTFLLAILLFVLLPAAVYFGSKLF